MSILNSIKAYVPAMLLSFIIVIVGWNLYSSVFKSKHIDPENYSVFCTGSSQDITCQPKWRVVIYLDIKACLACNEDMSAWIELEKKLSECEGLLSIWTSSSDSLDVAWAMKLEGLNSPVNVLDSESIEALGWQEAWTPVKVLLDNQCKPVKIIEQTGSSKMSGIQIAELLHEICVTE